MKKLWQKNKESKLDPLIEAFETKDDLLMDQKLVKYDCLASIAHAKMLCKVGILSKSELLKLEKGLLEILSLDKQGKLLLKIGDEDMHTKIENYLTQKYGEVGQKIHTGRSRNDQVLTAIRLYSKEMIEKIKQELTGLIKSFDNFSKKYGHIKMPGYTHMQKAMPSSVGVWLGAFVESLLDDLVLLKTAYQLNDQSPLGSAAGYGLPIKIDREYTKELLGFTKVQNNPLYCQNSRGKIEGAVLASLISILSSINKFASDVLLFTTSEFNYLTIAETLTSGSSIMPQKKNLDVAELLRSKVHLVLGNYTALISLSSNLPSGYNRDLQDSKKLLMESLAITLDSLRVVNILIKNITPNKDALEKAMTPELFATERVLELVKQGMPFRQAYEKVAKNLNSLAKINRLVGRGGEENDAT